MKTIRITFTKEIILELVKQIPCIEHAISKQKTQCSKTS